MEFRASRSIKSHCVCESKEQERERTSTPQQPQMIQRKGTQQQPTSTLQSEWEGIHHSSSSYSPSPANKCLQKSKQTALATLDSAHMCDTEQKEKQQQSQQTPPLKQPLLPPIVCPSPAQLDHEFRSSHSASSPAKAAEMLGSKSNVQVCMRVSDLTSLFDLCTIPVNAYPLAHARTHAQPQAVESSSKPLKRKPLRLFKRMVSG